MLTLSLKVHQKDVSCVESEFKEGDRVRVKDSDDSGLWKEGVQVTRTFPVVMQLSPWLEVKVDGWDTAYKFDHVELLQPA